MKLRFTIPLTSEREVGETYLNECGVAIGVILSNSENTTKISAAGDCAIKCDFDIDFNYLIPVWYDFNSHKFKEFTLEDSNNRVAGYIKPYLKDEDDNILTKYDSSLREFILLGL
jgi:hypothetical protein